MDFPNEVLVTNLYSYISWYLYLFPYQGTRPSPDVIVHGPNVWKCFERRNLVAHVAQRHKIPWEENDIIETTKNDDTLSLLVQWRNRPSYSEVPTKSEEVKFYSHSWNSRRKDNKGLSWYNWVWKTGNYSWKSISPKCLTKKVFHTWCSYSWTLRNKKKYKWIGQCPSILVQLQKWQGTTLQNVWGLFYFQN